LAPIGVVIGLLARLQLQSLILGALLARRNTVLTLDVNIRFAAPD
jgi:hypothetical protein